MYFIQCPERNKFSIKERNSTLRKNTHDKGRLLRDEGGALIYYSNPLFRDHFAIFRVTVHTLVGNYFYNRQSATTRTSSPELTIGHDADNHLF